MAVRVLAFDTSTDLTTVALCEGEHVLSEDDSRSDARHAELLLPRIQSVLAAAGVELASVQLIGVGAGPGSFTGVRVGLATAKGLGLALQKPVAPVVSLHALARQAAHAGSWVAPCLDAFKGELFAALYRLREGRLERVLPPFHAAPAEALARLTAAVPGEQLVLCGSGLRRYPEAFANSGARQLSSEFDLPRARVIAQIAQEAQAAGTLPALATIAPEYVRGSDAQLPKTPLRV